MRCVPDLGVKDAPVVVLPLYLHVLALGAGGASSLRVAPVALSMLGWAGTWVGWHLLDLASVFSAVPGGFSLWSRRCSLIVVSVLFG